MPAREYLLVCTYYDPGVDPFTSPIGLHLITKRAAQAALNWQAVGGFNRDDYRIVTLNPDMPYVVEDPETGKKFDIVNTCFTPKAWEDFGQRHWGEQS